MQLPGYTALLSLVVLNYLGAASARIPLIWRRAAGIPTTNTLSPLRDVTLDDLTTPQEGRTNQYEEVYETVFEDHWGADDVLSYYDYINDTLYQTISTGLIDQNTAYPIESRIVEPITPVDPDPGNIQEPLTSLNATPIFCGHRILVLLQYQADTPAEKSVRTALRQAWRLLAAIRNKWAPRDETDPVWKPEGTMAIPKKPNSLAGKVYTSSVDFEWGQYLPFKIQVLGRTRFSEDVSEWVILALVDPDDPDSQCPFTNDVLIPE
ncbi:hypothetical protein TWF696_008581 [Orbilia brochopaga]|uniref:Uncharacterized protein n=1 Tax=Orbilia brochopaga TaxID=3140254 RepID=A0AAV9UJI4_9PEZI